jgi:type III secretion system YscD/HrpQ family protein
VVPKMTNGEVTLTGTVPNDRVDEIKGIIGKIKQIPGVRIVNSVVKTQTTETGTVNISDHYKVTGKSRIGTRYTVVINGRILSENDELDGMTITKITPDRVLLESGGNKYRIDY